MNWVQINIQSVGLLAQLVERCTGIAEVRGSVSMVKNCDLGLENTALGLRPRAVFHHKDLPAGK